MRIAILEDQPDQAVVLESTLTGEGHDCAVFLAGQALIDAAGSESFDLFVLDREVPDVSGPEVLRWVRAHVNATVPVLFVTSRNTAEDIVAALDQGADDYMTKPFTRADLGARTRALLRRAYPRQHAGAVEVKQFRLESKTSTVYASGEVIQTTQREFDLAFLLFRNVDLLLSRHQIMELVWGRRAIDSHSRTVDTHISRLRLKLDLRPETGFVLSTVYNHGYRLEQVEPLAA